MSILFKNEFHQALRDGEITQTFRRWKRAKVSVGKVYKVHGVGALAVSAVDTIRVSSITAAEARKAGFPSRSSLLSALTTRSMPAPKASESVFRIRFQVQDSSVLEQPRTDGRLSRRETLDLVNKLRATDERSKRGPWVAETLGMIAENPQVAASQLAPRIGFELAPFKANVRKLKKLGLTMSHETGYELTPRGNAVLAAWTEL